MLVYSTGVYIPKRNGHGYNKEVRDAICGCCGNSIGQQTKYEDYKEFSFDERIKGLYKFCPFCSKPLYEEISYDKK